MLRIKEIKITLILLLALITPSTFASSITAEGTITYMSLTSTYIRVATTSMANQEGCSSGNVYFRLNFADDPHGTMYAAILAAKAANQKIFFMLAGCTGAYPKINAIYLPE